MPMTVVKNDLEAIGAAMERRASDALLKTAEWIAADVRKQMRAPKHGRVYRSGSISKTVKMGGSAYKKWQGMGLKGTFSGGSVSFNVGSKIHRASAPGEAPAVDTSNLINSVAAARESASRSVAYSTSDYAVPLEMGTRRMAPRPAFVPAAFRGVEVLWKLMKGALGGGK